MERLLGTVARGIRTPIVCEGDDVAQIVVDSVLKGDTATLHARLHRLQASCGLVGARRLADAVDVLRRAPESSVALERFDHAARDLTG